MNTDLIRILAALARRMDAGNVPFVIAHGERLALTREAMEHFGLAQGQTVSNTILCAAIEYQMDILRAEIALEAASGGY